MAQFKPSTQLAGTTNLSVLATVREGLVEHSFQRISHVRRLELVLNVLNTLRLGQRESLRDVWALPDLIGRIETIHEFRFSVVRPRALGERTRFLLSVTFDGGWEPYMRFIWRDLGTLLDLMFCHCERYPLAATSSYADYIAWVRDNEIARKDAPAFFYVDSPVSVGDQRALPAGTPPTGPAAPTLRQRALAALKPIAALHGMSALFTGPDAGILLRAAHDIVPDVRRQCVTQQALTGGDPARVVFAGPLAWFEQPPADPPVLPPPRGTLHRPDLQGGILHPYSPLTDGVLVLLRVTDRAKAVATLRALDVTPEGATQAPGPYANVAFTCAGLEALGESPAQIALFPQEFVQGMEARCGLLGDVRGNHPSQWMRPTLDADANGRLELGLVHVVLQLRGNFEPRGEAEPSAYDERGVHVDLTTRLRELIRRSEDSGLAVLAREPMVRLKPPANHPAPPGTIVDQLGFADGLSQPQIDAPQKTPAHWSDQVETGELFLGFANDRRDGPYPAQPNTLLHQGSFLVVRKLRQHVGTMLTRLGRQASELGIDRDGLLEAVIGRSRSGAALVAPVGTGGDNDFTFHADPSGRQCPLQSHARRANPRDGRQAVQAAQRAGPHPIPRVLRRGMSYGQRFDERKPDDTDRGIVFMAYCASIAEQFEVLQRWLAGGNSTHLPSTDADPLLGVPAAGRKREFGCIVNGWPARIDLGDDPFVTLQWGLYLFVPSLPALRNIGDPAPAAPPAPSPEPLVTTFGHWQERLESFDVPERIKAWAVVQAQPNGVLATEYGLLVADPKLVCDLLRNGDTVSVDGYGARMAKSVGLNHLGLDGPEHTSIAPDINAALASVKEPEALAVAHRIAVELIDQGPWPREPDASRSRWLVTIDTSLLADLLLARLCTHWFDLPDGRHVVTGPWHDRPEPKPRCPGDVLSASRYVFGPHPSAQVEDFGQRHGDGLRRAALAYLKEHGAFSKPISTKVEAAVRRRAGLRGKDEVDEEVARTVVGCLFGFTPTVYGNARTVIGAWLKETAFWELQLALNAFATHDEKAAYVRGQVERTMVGMPVPDMLWRRATRNQSIGGINVDRDAKIVLGLLPASRKLNASAASDPYLMFGGRYVPEPPKGAPIHPCPGYAMAMGVLTGLMLALLEAGTIQRGLATGYVVRELPLTPPP